MHLYGKCGCIKESLIDAFVSMQVVSSVLSWTLLAYRNWYLNSSEQRSCEKDRRFYPLPDIVVSDSVACFIKLNWSCMHPKHCPALQPVARNCHLKCSILPEDTKWVPNNDINDKINFHWPSILLVHCSSILSAPLYHCFCVFSYSHQTITFNTKCDRSNPLLFPEK